MEEHLEEHRAEYIVNKLETIATAIDLNTAEQRGSREELVEIVIAIQALTRALKEK